MRALLVTALAAIVITIAGIPMFMHPPTAYTGTHLRSTGAWVQPFIVDVEPGSPAYRAGLRSGDVVSCLSMRDKLLLVGALLTLAYQPGTPIDLCVKDPTGWRPVSFIADQRPPIAPIYGNDWGAVARLLGYAVFVLCAVILVLGRPGRATWTFFAYAIVAAPNLAIEENLSTLSSGLYGFLYDASTLAIMAQYGLLMQFAALVPDDRPPAGWRTTLYRVSIAVTVGLVLLAFARWFTSFYISPTFVRSLELAIVFPSQRR